MNKKFVLSFIFVLVIFNTFCSVKIFASENPYFDLMKKECSDYISFWEKLSTCSPYVMNTNNGIYQIFGENGNYCHVKMLSLDCNFPKNVLIDYSNAEISIANKTLQDINSGYLEISSKGNHQTTYINNINNSYCKISIN